jgi:aminoglycoside 2'-N-acetyltransferase I
LPCGGPRPRAPAIHLTSRRCLLDLQVVPSSALSRETLDQILELCDRAYGEDLREIFQSFVDPVHVLATADGIVLSHALWVTRWLAPGGRAPLRTAYVEAVATDPARQRQGFASATLRRVLREVEGFELAALCPSDYGQPLYARLGWETWTGPLSVRCGSNLIDTADESIMIHRLPLTPALRLSESMSAEWRPGEAW